jgi:hypothetical protein
MTSIFRAIIGERAGPVQDVAETVLSADRVEKYGMNSIHMWEVFNR